LESGEIEEGAGYGYGGGCRGTVWCVGTSKWRHEIREEEEGKTYIVDSRVVGNVEVTVVHWVVVEVTYSAVFVAVTVLMEASGALFSNP